MKLFIEISTSIYIPVYIVSTQKDFQLQFNLLSPQKRAIYKILKAWIKNDAFCNMY